jgi:hypothetical protein
MNTPSHVILNLAILHRRLAGRLTAPPGSQADARGSSTQTTAIILGSLLPDAALFVFYGWHASSPPRQNDKFGESCTTGTGGRTFLPLAIPFPWRWRVWG